MYELVLEFGQKALTYLVEIFMLGGTVILYFLNHKCSNKIDRKVNCNTTNVVYMLKCDKDNCRMQYIGETEREFKLRVNEHIGYAKNNQQNKTTGHHFNLPGHSWKNMKFIILEKVKHKDTIYREEREKYLIKKFGTYHRGMNKKP